MGFSGNNLPHATFRIWGIARITRNQMNVDMEDALSPGRIYVYAYVVAIGAEFLIESIG